MRILGIDPGLAIIGLGLIETHSRQEYSVLDWLTITTASRLPLADRLREIHQDLDAYFREQRPELCVVEKLFFATNEQTAIDVAQARGVILQTVSTQNIPIIEPTPLELKSSITGDGSADKKQIQDMLLHLLPIDEVPKPDDAADALALAVYGGFMAHRPSPSTAISSRLS